MKFAGLELRRVAMPLVAPFRTSFGTEHVRDVLLVKAETTDGDNEEKEPDVRYEWHGSAGNTGR